MDICTDFDVAMGQYVVELYGDKRTRATRSAVEAAVGDDRYLFIQAVNAIVCAAQQKRVDGMNVEDAVEFCKKEYDALHFDDHFCSWDYYDETARLVIGVESFRTLAVSEKLKAIHSIFEKGCSCPDVFARAGLILYCLRVITRFGLMTKDIEFMRKVSKEVTGLNEQERQNAVIPDCFVREI